MCVCVCVCVSTHTHTHTQHTHTHTNALPTHSFSSIQHREAVKKLSEYLDPEGQNCEVDLETYRHGMCSWIKQIRTQLRCAVYRGSLCFCLAFCPSVPSPCPLFPTVLSPFLYPIPNVPAFSVTLSCCLSFTASSLYPLSACFAVHCQYLSLFPTLSLSLCVSQSFVLQINRSVFL